MDNYSYNMPNMPPKKDNAFAIASLVLGIFSLICCCCFSYVSIGAGAISIIFFVLDRKKHGTSNGMAIAGLICSIFSVLISILSIVMTYTTFYSDFMEMYQSIIDSMLNDMNIDIDTGTDTTPIMDM